MRTFTDRVWRALCAGRAPPAVACRLLVAFALAALLWACSCAFLLLEPVA